MRRSSKILPFKLFLTISILVLITIIYSYFLSFYFYEKLYVQNVEQSLVSEGSRMALDYDGGPISCELREKIEWYNSKSEINVFIVNNPKELGACLPFEVDYDNLITVSDRQKLLNGQPVNKLGYEERFDRQVMATIVPLLDKGYLEGIIYLYVPLTTINEFTKEFASFLIIGSILFYILVLVLGTKWINKLTKPLTDMTEAAVKMSKGDFSTRVQSSSKDEIGKLATAFNEMSQSIQEADERKKEFIGDISHELRTPISYVKGYSDMMLSNLVKNEEDKEKYLKLIHREARHLERLVGDLLDLTVLESDEYQITKTPLPIAQIIEDAMQIYEHVVAEKEIEVIQHIDPEIIIDGDEEKIGRIIQNIMDNAIRYTNRGGKIIIKLYCNRNKCFLEIVDNGIGISKEDLSKIKTRFYRVNKGRSREDGGTGLGLSIVDKLVALHDGQLDIKSKLGTGTKVKITFPARNDILD